MRFPSVSKIQTTTLAISFALLAAVPAMAESVLIKRKFDAGASHLYETKTQVSQSTSGMPNIPGGKMEMKFDSTLCRKELLKDGKMGKKEVTTTIDRWVQSWDMMGNTLEFDSDDPENEESAPMVSTIFAPMVGESFKYEIGRDGKVLNFSGMDEISKKVDEKAAGNMVWPQLKRRYTDKAGRKQFAEDPLLIFPNKEIAVGETWNASSSDEQPGVGVVTQDYTYKLDKIGTENGRKSAIISYTVKISGGETPAKKGEGDEKIEASEVKGSGSGKAVFDIEMGIISKNESEVKSKAKVPASVFGGNQPGMADVETSVKSVTRLISEEERTKQKEAAAKVAAERKKAQEEEDNDDEDEDDEDDE